MLLWASMLSQPFWRVTPVASTAMKACSTKYYISPAEISALPTRQLINIAPFYQHNVHQALAIRLCTMQRYTCARQNLPQGKLSVDDTVLEELVRFSFNPEVLVPGETLAQMKKEGESAGYVCPGEAQEQLASAKMYKSALNGDAFILRNLVLRHWYAADDKGAYHFLNKVIVHNYSEDWLLAILLDYDCKAQAMRALTNRGLDVALYLRGRQHFREGNYKEARPWFKLAHKQKLPDAQEMMDACQKDNIAQGLSNMSTSRKS